MGTMAYQLEIRAKSIECADVESWTAKDMCWLLGSVVNGTEVQSFSFTPMRIGKGERHEPVGSPNDGDVGRIFTGITESNEVGLAIEAYDVDNNTEWKRNREDIGTITETVAPIVEKLPPPYGPIAAKVIENFPKVVDLFVKYDDDDELGRFAGALTFPPAMPENEASDTKLIRMTGETPFGDWDYTVELLFAYKQIAPPLGRPQAPSHLEPWEMSAPQDWTGRWSSAHVSCSLSVNAEDPQTLDVSLTDTSATPPREHSLTKVPIHRPVISDRAMDRALGSTSTPRAVDADAARVARVPSVLPQERTVEPTAVAEVLEWEGSGADYLAIGEDAVLELHEYVSDGQQVGAQLRYVTPVGPSALPRVEEYLTYDVV
jgi:hypothetical protein